MKKIAKILAMFAIFALAFSFAGCKSDDSDSSDDDVTISGGSTSGNGSSNGSSSGSNTSGGGNSGASSDNTSGSSSSGGNGGNTSDDTSGGNSSGGSDTGDSSGSGSESDNTGGSSSGNDSESGNTGGSSSGSTEQVSEVFVKIAGAIITGKIADSSVFIDGRTVTISDFYICDHEVTQAEYKAVIESLPSGMADAVGNSDKNPVNAINWYDAIVYCNKRSMKEGLTPCYTIENSTNPDDWGELSDFGYTATWDAAKCDFTANGYRLPTEAEWEYAARGGNGLTSTQYMYAGSGTLDEVAWYYDNSGGKTHEVKTKEANDLGLYDMSGNVWEWCWDWYGSISSDTPSTGSASGSSRCMRGGSWFSFADMCQIDHRGNYYQNSRNISYGFRVVRSAK